jgi:hypothetical protein
VKDGDKVTVIVGGMLVHGHWGGMAPPRGFYRITRAGVSGAAWAADVELDDEGTRWAHGHVTENDPRGSALLAAAALLDARPPRRAKPLEDMSKGFIKGHVSDAEFKSNLDLFDEDIANGYY